MFINPRLRHRVELDSDIHNFEMLGIPVSAILMIANSQQINI
jgi:hypothetical protein